MADVSNLGMGGNPFLGQNNPYLQQNIDAASADMVKNYNLGAVPATNAALVRSGSFGNSGLQEMQARDADMLQKNLGNLANTARMNDYTQQQGMYQWQKGFDENTRQFDLGFDRATYNDAFGQNQQNLQTGLGLLGMLNGLNTQDIGNSTNYQNTPLNYLTQFSNMAGAMGRGGQTSTVTGSGGGSDPITSALGGAQIGSSLWNRYNGGGNTYQSINQSAQNNGYGNTFQQNGNSGNVSYG
ncbi:hypothetical protein [Variovorax paradoxus]|uniref:hypothetical protein n=1 Tax=Variovorax paradoxus TaxID=34073 RepID=UPI003D6621F8